MKQLHTLVHRELKLFLMLRTKYVFQKIEMIVRNPTKQKRHPKPNIFFMKTNVDLNAEASLFEKIVGRNWSLFVHMYFKNYCMIGLQISFVYSLAKKWCIAFQD